MVLSIVRLFTCVMIFPALSPVAMAHIYVPPADEQWRDDRPRPAAKRLADLNVGEPRTVRMIYFLPNDRTHRADLVDSMKVRIGQVQTLFSEQMQVHGYGDKTFRFETDAQGEPLVHRVDGQHADGHYANIVGRVVDELGQTYDLDANIYFIVRDTGPGGPGGIGARRGKSGGWAMVHGNTIASPESWELVVHEMGHAFGLRHDNRDTAYFMSQTFVAWDRLSACAAEFLSVHPYFNSETSTEEGSPPTIQLLSSTRYPAGSESVTIQLRVEDPQGIHQVILFVSQSPHVDVKACQGVGNQTSAVVEFEYDGVIPGDPRTSLADPTGHPIVVEAVDADGNVRRETYGLEQISSYRIATLEGHTDQVGSVAFSSDGTLLASGSHDGTVRLWDVVSRQRIATLSEGTDSWISSVAFSPDGNTLASVAPRVSLWNVSTGQRIATLRAQDQASSVAFSPDGRTLAVGTWNNTIELWEVAGRQRVAILRGHTGAVVSVAFSRNGTLASGSFDKTVRLWNVQTRQQIANLQRHANSVYSVVFSSDGTRLASASEDGSVRLWDTSTRTEIAELLQGSFGVRSVSFSPDGALLASGDDKGTILLWDLVLEESIGSLGSASGVYSVSISPDGRILASGQHDGTVNLWDLTEWTGPRSRPAEVVVVSGDNQQAAPGATLDQPLVVEVRDQFGNPLPGATVTFAVTAGGGKLSGRFTIEEATTDADGRAERMLTLGSEPGTNTVGISLGRRELATFHAEGVGTPVVDLGGDFRTWHLPTGALRLGKGVLGLGDRAVAFWPDGERLAVATGIGVVLYEVATSRAVALLPTSPAYSVAVTPDGATVAAGLGNGDVELWEAATGASMGVLDAGWGWVTGLAFSPDGTTLVSGSNDQVIKLWDMESLSQIGTWQIAETGSPASTVVEYSPDGSMLVSGSNNRTVRLWDVETRTEIATLQGHTDAVTSVAFAPDGRTVASGSLDKTVRLWEVSTRKEIATLGGHDWWVEVVAFSPDGKTLASGSSDRTVILWDVASRRQITTFEEHTKAIFSLAYSRDGKILASGSKDGKVLLRDVETGSASAISGHLPVYSMALSSDGRTLASGAGGEILLWDAASGEQVATLKGGHTDDGIESVAFSTDGKLASGGALRGGGRGIVLWDVASRQQIAPLRDDQTVTQMVFSPNGRTLASGGYGRTATLWDIATRQQIAVLDVIDADYGVYSLAYSPDGRILASGSWGDSNLIGLWNATNRQRIATLEGHGWGSIQAVVFSPDGTTLASGGGTYEGTIRLWGMATRQQIAIIQEPAAGDAGVAVGVNSLAFSPDGAILASGEGQRGSGAVKLWEMETREQIATLEGHSEWIHALAFTPDGSTLVSGSRDGTMVVWDVSGWPRPRPSALEIISGDAQEGAPGAALAQPLVVEVRDQHGNPLPDAAVTFSVTTGEGQLSDRFTVEHTTTDAHGRAELILTLGPNPGPNIVGVSLGGRELATFSAQGVGTAVAEQEGDYRTWHLPRTATLRLGKGALGEGDRAVALSADGRRLAVASGIGVWLYEAATSRAQALLPTESAVHAVAFSLGGTLAAGLDNGLVELWEVETGERTGTLRHADWGRVPRVSSVDFSRDGSSLATGGWDQVIKVWDVETRRATGTWEVPLEDSRYVWSLSVALSPDGTRLVSGFQDGTVRLWDVATQAEVATLEGHTDRVASVAFAPDGRLLASGGGPDDPTVRLWDAATQTAVAILRGHRSEVRSVSFSLPDGGTLASAGGGQDPTVRLWNVATREPIRTLEEHTAPVHSVTFSRDGATLASGSADGTVLLRDMQTGDVARLSGHGSLSSMALSRDGVLLASGHQDGAIRLWHAATRTPVANLEGHADGVGSVSFSSDGALLASGSRDHTVKLWDVGTRTLVGTLEEHTGGVTSVSFSPDGSTLASAGGWWDATVRLWDVTTREQIGLLEGHANSVEAVAFSPPDGALLASGGGWEDKTVRLWDVGNQELIGILEGHEYEVNTLAFSPDGKALASSSAVDTRVWLWDVASRTSIATLPDVSTVRSLAFSPDGKSLVSGSRGTVTLWDVETRRGSATLTGHTGWVHSVAFTGDGATLASGGEGGTMLLWNLQPQPQSLTKVPESQPQGAAGTVLAEPFVVLVLDQYGEPLAGATVTFAVTVGGGTLSVTTATTDADGRASTTLTLGPQPGTNTVEATADRLEPVIFTAMGVVIAQTLNKLSGDEEEGAAGSALGEPFVVEVRDQNGKPLAGVTVTFAVTAGGGTLSATTVTTDADGRASATLTLGNTPGTNTVGATVAGLEPATFTVVGLAVPRTLAKLSGDEQQAVAGAQVGEPLVVSVRDQNGAALAGAVVSFAVLGDGGTLSAATDTTDAEGLASTTLTLGGELGPYSVEATVTGLDPVTFTATAKATPDFDGDGVTDFSDFFLFAEAFGGSDPRFDLDGSGTVDFTDFFLFAESFGEPARAKLVAMARELIGLPDGPQLQQNAPNPFNSETVITWFQLQPGPARLEVFALTGQRVAVLHQGPAKAGLHRLRWAGRDSEGRALGSGVYLYRLVTGEGVLTRKLSVLR